MKKLDFLRGMILGLFIGIIAIVTTVLGISKQLRTYIRTSLDGSSTVSELMNEVELMYISHYNNDIPEIDSSEFVNKYIEMIGDKWGTYLSPEGAVEYVRQNSDIYCGIGIATEYKNGKYRIIRVVEGTPAEEVGLAVGDIVNDINGVELKELTNLYGEGKATSAMRGEEGTNVEVGVYRNKTYMNFSITRKNIDIPTVEYEDFGSVRYIRIYSFSDNTYDSFVKLLNNGGKYVLDLRGNSGGNFDTVINIADALLGEGLIVKEVKGDLEEIEYTSDSNCIDCKFVILVDNGTASASELLAQVLKEYDKAYILGSSTCGKGTITDRIVLSNGGYLFISSGEYITVNDYHIEGKGVQVDEYYYDTDLIQRAVDILK